MMNSQKIVRTFYALFISSVIALTLSFVAFADTDGSSEDTKDVLLYTDVTEYVHSNPDIQQSGVSTYSAYPESFDLRSVDKNGDGTPENYISPVKLQNPWGTCWGFAAIAAVEGSIMYEADAPVTTENPNGLNLSERHLSYFTYVPLFEGDGTNQTGEGFHIFDPTTPGTPFKYYEDYVNLSPDEKKHYNELVLDGGGRPYYASTIFSSGIGPYQETTDDSTSDEAADPWSGAYRNNEGLISDDPIKHPYWKETGTWMLPYEMRFYQYAELEETRLLPSPATLESSYNPDTGEATHTYTYNLAGTNAIKGELFAGRPVAMYFCADTTHPGQESKAQYININPNTEAIYPFEAGEKPWAHYTCDPLPANHAVTIVGWDDNFKKENFTGSFNDDKNHTPEGDGAWIVKNSWGAKDRDAANTHNWGVGDSGYFYISYFDQSLHMPESFDFDENSFSNPHDYYIDQYDYMPSNDLANYTLPGETLKYANVFPSEGVCVARALSCETATPDTQVTYEAYVLPAPDGDIYTAESLGNALNNTTPQFTFTTTYQYAGYHRINLTSDEAIRLDSNEYLVVVVSQKTQDGHYALPLRLGDCKEFIDYQNEQYDSGLSCYSISVINPGESFYFETYQGSESWTDWTEFVQKRIESDKNNPFKVQLYEYDNPGIKAYLDVIHEPIPDESNPHSEWTKGTDSPLSFHITGNYDEYVTEGAFDGTVTVTDASGTSSELTQGSDYTVSEGSIRINLTPSYLNTLPQGNYTLTVEFSDGTYTAPFTIHEGSVTPVTPDTPSTPEANVPDKPAQNTATTAGQQTSGSLAKTSDTSAILVSISILGSLGAIALTGFALRKRHAQRG